MQGGNDEIPERWYWLGDRGEGEESFIRLRRELGPAMEDVGEKQARLCSLRRERVLMADRDRSHNSRVPKPSMATIGRLEHAFRAGILLPETYPASRHLLSRLLRLSFSLTSCNVSLDMDSVMKDADIDLPQGFAAISNPKLSRIFKVRGPELDTLLPTLEPRNVDPKDRRKCLGQRVLPLPGGEATVLTQTQTR